MYYPSHNTVLICIGLAYPARFKASNQFDCTNRQVCVFVVVLVRCTRHYSLRIVPKFYSLLKVIRVCWGGWFHHFVDQDIAAHAPLLFGDDKCLQAVHSAFLLAERFTEDPYPVI
nr:hypothetical protein CFP56_30389 [Quercus suber]